MFMLTRRSFSAGLVVLAASPARAADASSWQRNPQSAVRLVAGAVTGGIHRAGIEIELKPGWKTYWRYPGDAGVPPRFDWSGSENLGETRVEWPVPRAFETERLVSIGYSERVLFPVHVTPKDPARPVNLHLALDYAVCEKLCVPAFAEVSLVVPPGGGAHDDLIRAALDRVPRRSASSGLDLRAVRVDRSVTPARVSADIACDPSLGAITAFVEGPSAEWALPIPVVERVAPDLARISFTLDGAPGEAATRDATLTLTLAAGPHAVEAPLRLD
jgi:DsbC/DsbD-like thiol-disulfide interchange protein